MQINLNIISIENKSIEKVQSTDLSEEFDFSMLLANAQQEIELVDSSMIQSYQSGNYFPQQGNDLPSLEQAQVGLIESEVEEISVDEDVLINPNEIQLEQWVLHEPLPNLIKQQLLIDIDEPAIFTKAAVSELNANLSEQAQFLQDIPQREYVEVTNKQIADEQVLAAKSFIAVAEQPIVTQLATQVNQDSRDALAQMMNSFELNEIKNVNIDLQSVKCIYDESKGFDLKAQKIQEPLLLTETTLLAQLSIQKNSFEINQSLGEKSLAMIESREFAPDLVNKLQIMVRTNETNARVQINPAELGQMEINITQKDDKTHILFISNVESTRNLIEANLDKLVMNLSENGIDLGNVFVAQQDKNNAQQQTQDLYQTVLPSDVLIEENEAQQNLQSTINLLDIYV